MIHEDFLALAENLARQESGKPKQSSLRRAVSTAYYALFHSVAYLCAEQLVGQSRSKSREPFSRIYRSLDHNRAKAVFQAAAKFGPEAAIVGPAFIQLQGRRNLADYDPEPFPLGRKETLDLIELAAKAVQATRAMSGEQALLLAAHLIGKERK